MEVKKARRVRSQREKEECGGEEGKKSVEANEAERVWS